MGPYIVRPECCSKRGLSFHDYSWSHVSKELLLEWPWRGYIICGTSGWRLHQGMAGKNYFFLYLVQCCIIQAFDLFKHPIYFTFILQPTLGKLTLPKWQAVQQFRPWPPYQASDLFFPFSNSTSHHFVVGNQKCQFTQGYCNGPLKPGTRYR